MKIDDAEKIMVGEESNMPIDSFSMGELLQVAMGACLMDNGDIYCCLCNKLNECCVCGMEEQ